MSGISCVVVLFLVFQIVCANIEFKNGIVAIGNPERHVRRASHRGNKQQ